jgi:hypothetical protein
MATYVLNNPAHAGGQITFSGAPPANNDVAPCGSGIALLVVNPAANGNVTVSLPCLPDDGLTVGPRVVTVPQATSWLIPLVSSVYGNTVTLTYTGTLTTVQVAVITSPGT